MPTNFTHSSSVASYLPITLFVYINIEYIQYIYVCIHIYICIYIYTYIYIYISYIYVTPDLAVDREFSNIYLVPLRENKTRKYILFLLGVSGRLWLPLGQLSVPFRFRSWDVLSVH